MSFIKALYQKSKELFDHVSAPFPNDVDEREDYVETITLLLQERETLVRSFANEKSERSKAETKIGEEIVKMNSVINERLERVKNEIGHSLHELKYKKVRGQKYESPYEKRTIDGVFFDQDI